MNDQDLKKIFVVHKVDIPDHGFSERVTSQLPERRNILPQVVMAVFVMIGLTLTFSMLGITPLLEQLGSLITSISHMQMPSLVSVVSYLGVLALLGIIGYSVAQADVG